MAKNKVSDWSATPANNTDIGDINIAEGCAPSNINNAIRELMAQVKDMQTGADSDNFVIGGALTCSGNAVFSGSVSIPTTPLGVTSGGTGLATMAAGDVLYASASNTLARLASASTTTSVLLSGNTAPTWGKVALASAVSGTLPIANGGTGQTTATAAINALLPSQSGNSGKYLTTDGTDTSWATVSGGGGGTVTSVGAGAGMSFTTITGTGSVAMGTPSTLTSSTTNSAAGATHTHQVDFPVSSVRGQLGDTALASGNIVLSDLLSFGKSLNSNGYQKLPGGLIIQWGNATISGTTTVVSFSTSFSVACYSIIAIPFFSGDTGGFASSIGVSSAPTKTGCVLSTDTAATSLYFIAIGQ
jgi:hypothetical protein